ncbi:hypothetical protein ABEF93_005662 [Exophiala dermatitidis]
MMECIRRRTKASDPSAFKIKTKLNSDEAARRFNKIRGGLIHARNRITGLCLGSEAKRLKVELLQTEADLTSIIGLLGRHCVGEREYLGSAVLTFERILSNTTDLLLRVDLARQTGQNTPHGFSTRAEGLVEQLREGCKLLAKMEENLNVGAETRGKSRSFFSGWSEDVLQEHHDREHLFTGLGWKEPERCDCLDYR